MSPLSRLLFFTDKQAVTEYTQSSDAPFAQFNRELYQVYLTVKDKEYRWKHSHVDTFNEVYFQVTRIYNDHSGETEVYCRYLNDAKENMGTRYGANLIFSMVYAVIYMRQNPTFEEITLLVELENQLKESPFFMPLKQFAEQYRETHGCLSNDYPISPVPLRDLPCFDPSDWYATTAHFDQYTIKNIIARYPAKQDKLSLLNLIEKMQNEYETCGNQLPF